MSRRQPRRLQQQTSYTWINNKNTQLSVVLSSSSTDWMLPASLRRWKNDCNTKTISRDRKKASNPSGKCCLSCQRSCVTVWRCLSSPTTLFLGHSVATEKKQQKQQINSHACIKKTKTASQRRCPSSPTTLFLGRSVATEKKQQKQQINSHACI